MIGSDLSLDLFDMKKHMLLHFPFKIWGHSFSTYARRGGGGVKQMRTNAYKGGGGVDT